MNEIYITAVEALLGMVHQQAQKMPVTGEALQQALLKVEIGLDRASTENAPADHVAQLLNLRQHLLTAERYVYAQSSQY